MSSTSVLEAAFWHPCVPEDTGGRLAMTEEGQVVMLVEKNGKGRAGGPDTFFRASLQLLYPGIMV